jgi:hypothetical protein
MLYESLYIYSLAPYLPFCSDTIYKIVVIVLWTYDLISAYVLLINIVLGSIFFLYCLYTSYTSPVIYFMCYLRFVQDAGVHALSNVCHVDVERISKRKPGEVVCTPLTTSLHVLLVKYVYNKCCHVRLRPLCFPFLLY